MRNQFQIFDCLRRNENVLFAQAASD